MLFPAPSHPPQSAPQRLCFDHVASGLAGEAFTTEEFEEMMQQAKDLEKNVVYYDEHAQMMALET